MTPTSKRKGDLDPYSALNTLARDRSPDIVIRDSESLAKYLDVQTWSARNCSFQYHFESTLNRSRRSEDHTQCSTINVHDDLPQRSSADLNDDQFTILINSWRRNECLKSSIQHYLRCDDVAQIRVIWSDREYAVPPDLHRIQQTEPRLIFDEYSSDKLSDRFKYNPHWITTAIFSVDDDLKFSCPLISNAFRLWRMAPDYLIGFAPRETVADFHGVPDDAKRHRAALRFSSFYESDTAFLECRYSLLFGTLGGFLHRKYYEMYSADHVNGVDNGWKQIRDAVDHYVTAEDLTMSLLYSFNGGLPPMAVVVPESELMVGDFMRCSSEWSASSKMHRKSSTKRNAVFLSTLKVLGFYRNDSAFRLPQSTLFVDVMPEHDRMCWIG